MREGSRPVRHSLWRRGVCFFRESLSRRLPRFLRLAVDFFKVLPRIDNSRNRNNSFDFAARFA